MRQLAYCVVALHEHRNVQNADNVVFCKESFGKNHTLQVHLMYKDVNCFRNRSVHKIYCLKACQISKVHACSHEIIKKPCTGSNYKSRIVINKTTKMQLDKEDTQ